ncbi:DUF883 family protein [Dyella sp. KRB-257]|uniref:DUF883 family protein n=1 Tax=Dyella sp. KRB-257 TaxID=3400915 RepID=UPI003C05E361
MTKSAEIASNPPADRTAADRIEQGAERVKQATSHAVTGTKEAVDRAADRVEEGLHRATDKVADAATRTTEKAGEYSERGREVYDQAVDRAEHWMDQVRDYVREKPLQSMAIALGAGWLLGRLLRR